MKTPKPHFFCLPAALPFFMVASCWANVPTPAKPPSPPAGYCSTIYGELKGYLDDFNQTLGNPAPYGTLQIAQLQMADSNTGPAISGPDYLNNVMVQVQQLKAMGFDGVKVEVAFPVLYAPFFGGQSAMQPYLNFYQQLAQRLKAMNMKLVVENNVTLSTGTEVGWGNVAAYYRTLSWPEFIAGRATMAGTVAQYMQPDFLMLSEEPDNEALNAGQPNLNNPALAATMIAGEITAARLASLHSKLGAGFGTWMGPYSPSGLMDYLTEYLALPLDYIDMHIYPINTEYHGLSNFLDNALVIANKAAAALKPVAISESWPWKMEDSEFTVLPPDTFRARSAFSFWAPLDSYFIQTMEKLARYTRMLYLTSQGNDFFLAYQNYGGTAANGGAANCTCTTESCSDGEITAQENSLALAAGRSSQYTATGFSYNGLLVTPPDKNHPVAPSRLTGTAGYNSANLSWTGSGDNVGVAGYNVFRCAPAPCTGKWIANTAVTTFYDSSLNDNTPYQYTVQAFDMANNTSSTSNTITLTTALNTPPNPPRHVVATAVSSNQINLSWHPSTSGGIGKYVIYRGTSRATLNQVGTMPGDATSFTDRGLHSAMTYYYAVTAFEDYLESPMSNIASATTTH